MLLPLGNLRHLDRALVDAGFFSFKFFKDPVGQVKTSQGLGVDVYRAVKIRAASDD